MRTFIRLLLLLTVLASLIVSADALRAQMNPDLWLLQDAHVPSNEMVLSFHPVSDMVCWAVTVDTSNTPPSGYIRTTDGGGTWTYGRIAAAPDGMIWQIAPVDAETAYAAVTVSLQSNSKGIYKTTNGGSTWRQLDVYGSSRYGPAHVWFFDATNGVAVGDPNLETYTTSDGGEHWNQVTMYAYTNEYTWIPAGRVGNCAWFSTYGGSRVFGTTDKGHTWFASPRETQFRDWYPSLAFQDSLVGLYGQKKVEAITPFQFRRTTDGGVSWTVLTDPVLAGLSPTSISYIPGTRASYLVAGGMQDGNRGLAYTTDAGASWALLDTVGACFIGFASPATGWCMPREHSNLVYKYVGPALVTSVDEPAIPPTTANLRQNYPNPFNPVTRIRLTIADRRLTVVSVYDLLGREVAMLMNEVKDPGTYEVMFDASGLASGVYVYRLSAGEYVASRTMLLMK